MTTFALVAYLVMGGHPHAYVLDSGLTIDDCTAAIAQGVSAAVPNFGRTTNLETAPLFCEAETN
jgi:hypothetical protein